MAKKKIEEEKEKIEVKEEEVKVEIKSEFDPSIPENKQRWLR